MPEERRIATAKVGRKNQWGEYQVKAYDQHGKRWPECDYYTSDKKDAEGAAKLMVKDKD